MKPRPRKIFPAKVLIDKRRKRLIELACKKAQAEGKRFVSLSELFWDDWRAIPQVKKGGEKIKQK